MTKKKKSIYPLWVILPAIVVYTIFFRCSHCDQPGMLFHRLEYGTVIHPGFQRPGQLCGAFKGSCFSQVNWQYISVCPGNHCTENSGRIFACTCNGKKDTRKRADANHLLCTMCYQYYSGGSII